MRLARIALAVAVAGLAANATLASAASSPPVGVTITDQGGDANGINSQGFSQASAIPATKTPVQMAGADILSVSFGSVSTSKTVKKKVVYTPTALQVVMTLAAPPQANVIFRATPVVGQCTTFFLFYTKYADGGEVSGLRDNCPGFAMALPTSTTETVPVDSVVVAGSTITWTLKAGKSLPAFIKAGQMFTSLSAHSRMDVGTSAKGAATAPAMDDAAGAATYTYGK